MRLPRFEVWQSTKTNRWHWRHRSSNNEIDASGQSRGFGSAQGAERGCKAIRRTALTSRIVRLSDDTYNW